MFGRKEKAFQTMRRNVEHAFRPMIEASGNLELPLVERPQQTAITRGTTVESPFEASNLRLDGFSLQVE